MILLNCWKIQRPVEWFHSQLELQWLGRLSSRASLGDHLASHWKPWFGQWIWCCRTWKNKQHHNCNVLWSQLRVQRLRPRFFSSQACGEESCPSNGQCRRLGSLTALRWISKGLGRLRLAHLLTGFVQWALLACSRVLLRSVALRWMNWYQVCDVYTPVLSLKLNALGACEHWWVSSGWTFSN